MEFYNAKEISELLNVHINTVRRWIQSNELKSYKLGRSVRVDKKDFEEFIKRYKKEN